MRSSSSLLNPPFGAGVSVCTRSSLAGQHSGVTCTLLAAEGDCCEAVGLGRDHRQNGSCSWALAAPKLRPSDLDFDLFCFLHLGRLLEKLRRVELLQEKEGEEDKGSCDALLNFEKMLLKVVQF